MAKLHIVCQSKGGVGKSFISYILAQYLQKEDSSVKFLDADPNNHSLVAFLSLRAKIASLNFKNGQVKSVGLGDFDEVFSDITEALGNSEDLHNILLDTGSTTFAFLYSYFSDSDQNILHMFKEFYDLDVIFHMPICGGAGKTDCITSINRVIDNLNFAKTVVWFNNYPESVFDFNDQERINQGLNPLELIFDKSQFSKIFGYINMPQLGSDTFMKNFRWILDRNMTFNDFLNLYYPVDPKTGEKRNKPITRIELKDETLTILQWSRISKIREIYFNLIDNLRASTKLF